MLTKEQRTRILSNRLDDQLVRMTLSGFLHQELRHRHGLVIPPERIEAVLAAYVGGLERFLELAMRASETGYTPRDWESNTKH